MTQNSPRLVVTPPPICNSPTLRKELSGRFPQAWFNTTGRYLSEEELIHYA
ncbi:MAG: hydroxyacid dehydrogenase, partial [Nitrospinae bacterium]|nr:hydroxyacid dehydrogenase [Nitrospinota bacterium]